MPAHPSLEQFAHLLAGSLDGPQLAEMESHLEDCLDCQRRLAKLTEQSEPLHLRSAPDRHDDLTERERQLLEAIKGAHRDAVSASDRPVDLSGPPRLPMLPGYQVLEVLGEGGAGVVYKARDERLGRLVALKVLRAGTAAGPREQDRFHREAHLLARLQHPNIVQIFEVGEVGGVAYLALEYVEGGTLAAHCRGIPQPARAAAALVEILARAIHAAHEQGILHRDLKPANVLLARSATSMPGADAPRPSAANSDPRRQSAMSPGADRTGLAALTPKISDFGLARCVGEHLIDTHSGAILGTPSYMAPEQAAGRSQAVGPGADLYALGCMLYELLTGRPPHRGPTPLETLLLAVHTEPVPIRRLCPGVPADLETVCLKCLRKEPARRYASALELADDLRRFLTDVPILARPVGLLERSWKWTRRHPAVALLLGTSLLATLILITVWISFTLRLREEQAATERQRQLAVERAEAEKQARDRAEHEQREARRQWLRADTALYAARLAQAQRELQDRHFALAEGFLAACPERHRSFEYHLVRQQCQSHVRTLASPSSIHALALSPDGRSIALACADHRIRVFDRQTGEEKEPFCGHTCAVFALAFSPRGDCLVSAGGIERTSPTAPTRGEMKLWTVASRRERLTFTGVPQRITSVTFVDASTVAARDDSHAVRLWDTTSGAPRAQTLRVHRGMTARVHTRPDGKALLLGAAIALRAWHLPSFADAFQLGGEPGKRNVWGNQCETFHPQGRYLAIGQLDGTIRIWEPPATQPIATLRHSQGVSALAYFRNGQLLVAGCVDGSLLLADPASGQMVQTWQGHVHRVISLAITPDDRFLVSAGVDRRVRIWDRHPRHPKHTLTVSGARVLALNPGGRDLAAIGPAAQVHMQDMQTGAPILPPRRGLRGTTLGFSAAGDRLAIGDINSTITIWDRKQDRLLPVIQKTPASLTCLAFSPDGQQLAAAATTHLVRGPPLGGSLHVWDVATNARRLSIAAHGGRASCVAFSPDGSLLVSGGEDGLVQVWNAHTGRHVRTLQGPTLPIHALAFRADGQRLVAATGSTRYDGEAGKLFLWDLVNGRLLHTLIGHTSAVLTVAFAPDGRRIASGSADTTVRLWDVETGLSVLVLQEHSAAVRHVVFRADGTRLLSASDRNEVTIWEGVPQAASPTVPE